MTYRSAKRILSEAGYKPKMGRPKVGESRLPGIAIEGDLRAALIGAAKTKGMSLAEARRAAYELFIGIN